MGILGLCEKPRIVITIRGFSSASWGFYCACALSQIYFNITCIAWVIYLKLELLEFQYTKPYTDIAPTANTQYIARFLCMNVLIHIQLLHQLRIHVKHFRVSSYHIVFNTQIESVSFLCVLKIIIMINDNRQKYLQVHIYACDAILISMFML